MPQVARLVLTAALFVGFAVGVGPVAGAVFLMYLLVSWFVRPRPDLAELGWSTEGDLDRNLLLLSLVLAPGYLLAEPVAQSVRVAVSTRQDF